MRPQYAYPAPRLKRLSNAANRPSAFDIKASLLRILIWSIETYMNCSPLFGAEERNPRLSQSVNDFRVGVSVPPHPRAGDRKSNIWERMQKQIRCRSSTAVMA